MKNVITSALFCCAVPFMGVNEATAQSTQSNPTIKIGSKHLYLPLRRGDQKPVVISASDADGPLKRIEVDFKVSSSSEWTAIKSSNSANQVILDAPFSQLEPGSYDFRARTWDSDWNSASQSVKVVIAKDTDPVLEMDYALLEKGVVEGAVHSMTFTVQDSDPGNAKVWLDGVEMGNRKHTWTRNDFFARLEPGEHRMTFRVEDESGYRIFRTFTFNVHDSAEFDYEFPRTSNKSMLSIPQELRRSTGQGSLGDYAILCASDVKPESGKWPLIIWLHGGTSGRDDGVKITFGNGVLNYNNDNNLPAIRLYPHAHGSFKTKDLNGLLEFVKSKYPIDEDRIHLTGHSKGGQTAWHWAAANPEHFASLVSSGAGTGDITVIEQAAQNKPVFSNLPALAYCGVDDTTKPPKHSKNLIAAKNSGEAQVGEYIEITQPGSTSHSGASSYTRYNATSWLMEQVRAGATPPNVAPELTVTSPAEFIAGTAAELVATATDTDGTIASISVSVENEVIAEVVDSELTLAIGEKLIAGIHTLVVEATDDDGATAAKEVVVSVAPQNIRPVVEYTFPTEFKQGSAAELSVTATDTDGTIEWVNVFVDGVKVASKKPAEFTMTLGESLSEGAHTIKVVAKDNEDAYHGVSCSFTVLKKNVKPVVSFDIPAEVTAGDVLTVSANVTDADGTVELINIHLDGHTVSKQSTGVFTFDISTNNLEPGIHIVRLAARDNDDEWRSLTQSFTVLPAPSMESGVVEVNHDWTQIDFEAPVHNPVVITGVLGFNGSEAATLRVRNVTENGFEVKVEEWEYLDGYHSPEQITYMVMTEGVHDLGELMVEARKLNAVDHLEQGVEFTSAFDQAPVVLSTVGSDNDEKTVIVRQKEITETGLTLKLQEQELWAFDYLPHAAETVYVIAVEQGTSDDGAIKAGLAEFDGGSNSRVVEFDGSFVQPTLFGALQTCNGNDPTVVRCSKLTNASAEILLQEEQSRDEEVDHTRAEQFGWLVIGK